MRDPSAAQDILARLAQEDLELFMEVIRWVQSQEES